MYLSCPFCEKKDDYVSDCRTIVSFGSFHRTSDSKDVRRFRCHLCKKTFSQATKDPCFKQKKRQKNKLLFELLASSVSMRRSAKLLRINRTTVARKLAFLGREALARLRFESAFLKIDEMQFDDLETFEHTKYKPLSVTLAVTKKRRILGFEVAQMAAKGLLSEKAKKKYGHRYDDRRIKRRILLRELAPILEPGAIVRSDSNPYYIDDVRTLLRNCVHVTHLGQRGAITGQGELKKIIFDPLYSLNHTCAMFRANICRLVRKTWCTTKKKDRLTHHLAIYAVYHNDHLKGA